jgi:flagellar basal body-associated protein FliL
MKATLNNSFGQIVLGTALVSIGSTSGNQLMLNDPNVGAYHAEVRLTGQRHSIMDLGSGAGTFVNEQRLPPNVPRILQNGDNVRVGNIRLTYTVTSGSSIRPAVYAAPGQLPGSGYARTVIASVGSSIPPIGYAAAGSNYSGYRVPPAPYGSYPYSVPATPQSSVPPPNPYVSDPYRASAGVFGAAGYGAPPPPPKQRSRRGLWIMLSVIGVVLVLAVILLAVVGRRSSSRSIQASPSTPTLTLTNYCNALKKGDYQTAYNQLSSFQQHQQAEAQLAATLSNVTDCSVNSVNDTAGSGTITYTISNGQQVVADEKLIKENNVWKMATEQVHN